LAYPSPEIIFNIVRRKAVLLCLLPFHQFQSPKENKMSFDLSAHLAQRNEDWSDWQLWILPLFTANDNLKGGKWKRN